MLCNSRMRVWVECMRSHSLPLPAACLCRHTVPARYNQAGPEQRHSSSPKYSRRPNCWCLRPRLQQQQHNKPPTGRPAAAGRAAGPARGRLCKRWRQQWGHAGSCCSCRQRCPGAAAACAYHWCPAGQPAVRGLDGCDTEHRHGAFAHSKCTGWNVRSRPDSVGYACRSVGATRISNSALRGIVGASWMLVRPWPCRPC